MVDSFFCQKGIQSKINFKYILIKSLHFTSIKILVITINYLNYKNKCEIFQLIDLKDTKEVYIV